jgi:AcrR family transcriptional regulator
MIIPVEDAWPVPHREHDWARLDGAAKRERLLCAAGSVFARDGLDAPMPAVAAAAGAGVASVYRQFPSKRELLAALVVRRMDEIVDAAGAAAAAPGDRWSALTGMIRKIVEQLSGDDFVSDARMRVVDHPDVIAATDHATRALERLMDDARAEGRLRADATTLDLRLLFAATRAAKQIEPHAWQRMLVLMVDALDAR